MNLTGLESVIEAGAKELALDREALARLKTRYPEYFDESSSQPETLQRAEMGIIPGGQMAAAISLIMQSDINKEWTSSELCDRLEDQNFPMNANRNIRMGQLNEVLAAMTGSSLITQVEKGVGRRPGRYKWGTDKQEAA